MKKNYKIIFSKKDETLSDICKEFYGDDKNVDNVFNFKDENGIMNKERIKQNYFSLPMFDRKEEADKNLIAPNTLLLLPTEGMKFERNFYKEEISSYKITELKEPYWTVDIKDWWKKRENVLNIEFENQRFIKQFSKIYVRVYSRATRKVVNLTGFILQGNVQVGSFGGGFSLTLQPVQGKRTEKGYEIDMLTYAGDQFLSKTVIGIKNINEVRGNFYFEKVLNSQDVVFIKFDEDFNEPDFITSDEDYDMIGLIDKVKTNISQTNENFEASINIQGRDLSKLLIEDGTYFYPWEFYAKNSSEEKAYVNKVSNVSNFKDKNTLTRIFGRLNDLELGGNRTVKHIMNFIIEKLKVINLDLKNTEGVFNNIKIEKDGIWNFVEFQLEDEVAGRTLTNSNIATMKGSVINFFKQVLQEPFVELLTDTIGNKFRIMARTPPTMFEAYEKNLTMVISTDYLISENVEFGDKDVYSWFLLSPNARMFGNEEYLKFSFPAVYFEKYAKIYGSRKYEKSHSYTFYKALNELDEEAKLNSKVQTAEDLKFLIKSFIGEQFLKKGTLTFQNIKGLKRGMNVFIPETNMLYYVDGYNHNCSVTDRTTTVNVSRGINKKNISLFKNLVKIEIDEEKNILSKVVFNEENFETLLMEK